MKISESQRNEFLERSSRTLDEIYDLLMKLPRLNAHEFEESKTALIIVDMINGFTREGALKSDRVAGVIKDIADFSRRCDSKGIRKLVFADCHTEASPEFDAYPQHCILGSTEVEVVEELKEIGGYTLIKKNSTNGFIEGDFQAWLKENEEVQNFIVTGDCTDICIQQFAITLKNWFNMINRKVRIIVPLNMVETYDLGVHNGDLMNVIALYNMLGNGIEVVTELE